MTNNRAQLLITAVDQTRSAFDSIKRNLGDLGNAARSINGLLGALGLAVSAAGLGAMVKASIDSADSLFKLSQRVGITVESLSTLMPVANLAGVSTEKFEAVLRKLAMQMVAAATGSDQAARSFAAAGVAVKDQDGDLRATEQVLLDLAERFRAMPDGAEKSALAVRLFGKAGADLIPFLNQGRDGIETLRAELEEFGLQIGSETAAQAGVFNDSLAKARLAAGSLGNRIMGAFLPAMTAMAQGLVESAKQGGTLRAVLDGVVLTVKVLALGAAAAVKALTLLGESISARMAATKEALSGNFEGAKSILNSFGHRVTQQLDELAAFRNSLFDPRPIDVAAPSISPNAGVLDQLRKQNGSGQLALAKARADAEFKVLKDGIDRQASLLETAFEERLISFADYYLRKTELEQQAIDAEIQRTQALLQEQRRLAADPTSGSKAAAEIAKLEAELIVLNNRRGDAASVNARKAVQGERELREALAAVREELLEVTGTSTTADRRSAIERQYADLLERLQTEGDTNGQDLVNRLIDTQVAEADLATYERQFNDALSRMRTTEQSINLQREAGLLTESQARQRILALHRETGTALEGILPQLEQAAASIGPEAVARVQAWKNEIAQVQLVVNDVAVAIKGSVQDGFVSFFEAIGSGAKTAKEAVADFGRSVLATLNRIAAQKLGEAVFGAMSGAASGGGGFNWASLAASLFAGFSQGGYVSGPGTSTSDSILARLSAGEFVVRAAAVRQVGVAFLQSLNGLSRGPRFSQGRWAFAEGGPVVPAEAVAAAGPGAGAVRIVNVLDPALAADYLNSSAGERVVMNLIQRNAASVRTILGS